MKRKKEAKKGTQGINLLNEDTAFGVKEAYQIICSNMMFSVGHEGIPSKVFAITSAEPGDGKSATTANLAISFAMLGKKVLLVDMDMHKPTQHKLWGFHSERGISNLISGVDDCIFHEVSELPLTIIGSGILPPNPGELVLSPRFEHSISLFKEMYDYVLLDTPPISISDTQTIIKNADSVAVVVRAEKTDQRILMRAMQTMNQCNAKCCGFILNDVNLKHGIRSYPYSYYEEYENK